MGGFAVRRVPSRSRREDVGGQVWNSNWGGDWALVLEDGANGALFGDEGEHPAAAAAGAGEDVDGEDLTEQVGPIEARLLLGTPDGRSGGGAGLRGKLKGTRDDVGPEPPSRSAPAPPRPTGGRFSASAGNPAVPARRPRPE